MRLIAGFNTPKPEKDGAPTMIVHPRYAAASTRVQIAGSSDTLVFYSVYVRYMKVNKRVPKDSATIAAGI